MFAPTWMSLTLLAVRRSITETVPGPSFDTRPVRPPRRIAAPYGNWPVLTYRIPPLLVSITAAWSARFSGTSSVRPSPETASRSGQESVPEVWGGKFSGTGAPDGGGTGIVRISFARPLLRL